MDNLVQSIKIDVYKDMTLAVYPDACVRSIDCNFTKIADENISLTAGGNKCINWQAGDVWPNGTPEGVTAVQSVKIKTPKGFLWITPESYADLTNACNACCTS